MRLIYFSQDYTPHDYRFLERLAGTPHEVFFMRLEDGGYRLEDRRLPANVKLIDWWGGRRLVRWWELSRAKAEVGRVLERLKPDLVHAGPVQRVARLAAANGFHPLVTMSWGSDLLHGARRGLGRRTARWVLARTDVLACDCQAVSRRAEHLGMPEDRIIVFPWGVDLAHFVPGDGSALRRKLGWDSEFVILWTRSWERLYGVETFIKAFLRAAQEMPNLRLLMLGDGSLHRRVEGMLKTAEQERRVYFAGQARYDELPSYYRAADLYVSASVSDGSSISLLEAMACGLPAVVTDIASNREWIAEDQNGWRFRPGDPGDLLRAFRLASASPEKRRRISQLNRRLAEKSANWDVNFGRLLQAYDLAIAQGSGQEYESA
jgi:glycosyltransferase involved in cell wall biosynthesis